MHRHSSDRPDAGPRGRAENRLHDRIHGDGAQADGSELFPLVLEPSLFVLPVSLAVLTGVAAAAVPSNSVPWWLADNRHVLRLETVCKSYNIGTPVEVVVLHDIDLSLDRGEFVALIGPSDRARARCSTLSA